MRGPSTAAVALVQGAFYVATGVGALVDLDGFMAVTGPKTDLWLVKTVGVLVAVIGAVFLLAAIDVIYVSNGTISPIYLLAAAAEVALAGVWALARRRG